MYCHLRGIMHKFGYGWAELWNDNVTESQKMPIGKPLDSRSSTEIDELTED